MMVSDGEEEFAVSEPLIYWWFIQVDHSSASDCDITVSDPAGVCTRVGYTNGNHAQTNLFSRLRLRGFVGANSENETAAM